MERNKVILVDKNDNELGVYDKMQAHIDGRLHRAFSAFIFNNKGEVLLQQRALDKYHSGGLWTNTVCSHPQPDENLVESVEKRLIEEMGFTTKVSPLFFFVYKYSFQNGLTEHELDHVFIGKYNKDPQPNSEEVSHYKWITINLLMQDIEQYPDSYTPWLRLILEHKKFEHALDGVKA